MAHHFLQAPGLTPPIGYADGTKIEGPKQWVVLGGHVAFNADRELQFPNELLPQIELTLKNLKGTLESAGAGPEHLVNLTIYTTDVPTYRKEVRAIGKIWRDVLGKNFPAMTLVGISELFEPGAVIEIDGTAAIYA